MASGSAIRIASGLLLLAVFALAVAAGGQQEIARTDGTAFSDPACSAATQKQWFNFSTKSFECQTDATGGGGGVPAGAVVMIVSGSCSATLGTGWTESAALAGKFVLGTTNAAADIGGTGGQDTVTAVLNHTHGVTVTDPGHTHTQTVNSATTGGASGYTPDTSTNNGTNSGYSTASNTTGITAATANPAGGVASIDNRPAFVKVIFCQKD